MPEKTEESELLCDCIHELSEINRAIILLWLDGFSHNEIAQIAGISSSNTGTRLGRIKIQLKEMLTSNLINS